MFGLVPINVAVLRACDDMESRIMPCIKCMFDIELVVEDTPCRVKSATPYLSFIL